MSRPVFIQNLIDDHRAFEAAFAELRRAVSGKPEDLAPLIALCDDFLISFHQAREEDLIYPLLRRDPRLRAGGPECVLHFDFFMMDRPLERALRLCRRENLPSQGPRWSAEATEDQNTGSPLCIPGEDHEAGRVLIRSLQEAPPADSPASVESRLRLLEEFLTLQSTHHRREEGCLFRICEDLIDENEWHELSARETPWQAPLNHEGMDQVIAALKKSGWKRFAT